MWDLSGPGLEPMSPALAGRFLTTVPPGKPLESNFFKNDTNELIYKTETDLQISKTNLWLPKGKLRGGG